jgi:hypothetical protein
MAIAAPRVFNDFSTSTLDILENYPQAVIDDRNLTDDGMGGSFANRHDILFSHDDGMTPFQFITDWGFTMSGIFTLEAGASSPRKEAGIRINSSVTGDALFLVNSDAGEIVAFGGGAPFYSFSEGAQPDYTPGTPILMGVTYSGDQSSPRTIEYFIDRTPETPGGVESSGPLEWQNTENGPVDFYVGYYGQISPANANDFLRVTITDMKFCSIPEPGTFVQLFIFGCALIGILRRR